MRKIIGTPTGTRYMAFMLSGVLIFVFTPWSTSSSEPTPQHVPALSFHYSIPANDYQKLSKVSAIEATEPSSTSAHAQSTRPASASPQTAPKSQQPANSSSNSPQSLATAPPADNSQGSLSVGGILRTGTSLLNL